MSHRLYAFTLVELLVVMVLVALLIAMFSAVLASSRVAADRAVCLNNMSQLEKAHCAYIVDHDGVTLGTSADDHKTSWLIALREYNGHLLMRSPLDTSPHFGGGTPIAGRFRLTSYAINANLSPDHPGGMSTIDEVANPCQAVHFVIKVFEGPNAVLDNVNPRAWHAPGLQAAMANAAKEIQLNAHGGEEDSPNAISAYGFLDGHAKQATFEEVYGEAGENGFNPQGSR